MQFASAQKAFVYAQKGFIDLSVNDLETENIDLDGQWEFYWEELITPGQFGSFPTEYGEVPVFWKHYEEGFDKFGFGTYRLVFMLSDAQQSLDLGLRLNNVHNSYTLWVNGELLCQNGEVGEDYASSVPMWLPRVLQLHNLQKENEIVIQVSNFRHRNGGIQDAIEIGNYESFALTHKHQFASELFLAGGCFVLGCFFIGLFFFWRNDRAALHFGIFTLFFGSRVMLVGSRSLVETFNSISWDFCIRLEYLGMFAMHFFMFHFIYHAFEKQTNLLYLKILKWTTVLLVLICAIPGDYFTYLTIPNNYYLVLSLGYSFVIFSKALKAGVSGAIWAIMSVVIFFFTTIPLLLEYSNLFITNPVVLSLCYMSFLLSMSLVFASRFGKSFTELETLSEKEKKKTLEIVKQNESIEKRNQLINDSINYAEKIQNSLLPSQAKLKRYFNDCFLFFKPQGTVSGDFYWVHPTADRNESYIAIADCTGHGVPGAFVSMIAINSLDNIVAANDQVSTSTILTELNDVIHSRLQKNDGDITMVKDGLDIIVCKINLSERTVVFSAAHHKLFVIKANGDTELIKGDRHHIGSAFESGFSFNERKIELDKGDQIFMFSDGIYDQKGGVEGKKLYLQRTKDLLISINDLPMDAQHTAVANYLNDWIGDSEQLDDMVLFSLKF